MEYFEPSYFLYKNNQLFCEDICLSDIAKEVGTPTYVYSKNYMVDSFKKFESSFKKIPHKIFYACKSNFNINVIRLFNQLGAGVDVNSGGEFLRALKASVDPSEIIFSGVGKTKEEIELLLKNNVHLIKAESLGEIELINDIANSLEKSADIAIRVNPNVDPETHPYISTGLAENKFGIDERDAIDTFRKAQSLPYINVIGIDMHIGSQILTTSPYREAVEKIVAIVNKLKNYNIFLSHIDIGGGMGVNYLNEQTFSARDLASEIEPVLLKTDCKLYMEPGRYLTANSGCLLTKVLYTKNNRDKNFIIVDAAMNDLLRPSIYNAYHHIQPTTKINKEDFEADIVGPICESGDFMGKNRTISKCNPDDLLAIMSAGAYGMVMASNYNARRRPVEVMVDKNDFSIIRARENYDQIMENDQILW